MLTGLCKFVCIRKHMGVRWVKNLPYIVYRIIRKNINFPIINYLHRYSI